MKEVAWTLWNTLSYDTRMQVQDEFGYQEMLHLYESAAFLETFWLRLQGQVAHFNSGASV
jgi:hypothetical protein